MTNTKKIGRAAMLLVGGALLTMLPALAQDTSTPPPPPPAGATAPEGRGHGRGGPVAAALAQMNLTPDQQKVARDAQMDSMTKMKALRDDTTLDQKDRRSSSMPPSHRPVSSARKGAAAVVTAPCRCLHLPLQRRRTVRRTEKALMGPFSSAKWTREFLRLHDQTQEAGRCW
jgi:hypothetical protein